MVAKKPITKSWRWAWNFLSQLRYVLAEFSVRIASDLPTATGNRAKIIMLKEHGRGNGTKLPGSDLTLFWTQLNIIAVKTNLSEKTPENKDEN